MTTSARTYAIHTGSPAPTATRIVIGISITICPWAKLMTPVVVNSTANATAIRP